MTTNTPPARTKSKQRKNHFFVMPVNSCLSAVLCIGGLVSSGWISLHIAESKQDRTVTVEQILARRRETAERFKNNPNMPPQARAMAMAQLNGNRVIEANPPAPLSLTQP